MAGNLFAFNDIPITESVEYDRLPSSILQTLLTGTSGWHLRRSDNQHISGLEPLLKRLRNLGVVVYWIVGSQELNLNQTILERLNDNQPVDWIRVNYLESHYRAGVKHRCPVDPFS